MAGKQVNIDIKTTANTAGVEQATNSLQKLGETTTTSLNVSNKEASRFGARMANVGNQLQDVAVQAQSGTSAITILAQQGPQLLGSFGPQGAIAGAVLAAGALILSTMIKTTEAAKKAAQDAWTAADEFAQKAKDAFKEAGGKEADEFISKQERIVRLTEASTQAEIDLAGQQRERIKAQGELIKSQEDLAIASIKYLEATGQITDAENRISEVRGEARESQKELAVADIEASVKPAEIRYKGILANLENAKEEKIRTEESITPAALWQRSRGFSSPVARKALSPHWRKDGSKSSSVWLRMLSSRT